MVARVFWLVVIVIWVVARVSCLVARWLLLNKNHKPLLILIKKSNNTNKFFIIKCITTVKILFNLLYNI